MTSVSKKFESIVKTTQKKLISQGQVFPVRTDRGLLVGDILIVNRAYVKDIIKNDEILYKDINLNAVAVKIANLLALKKNTLQISEIYQLDQDYGKWFHESEHLLNSCKKASQVKNFERADILRARYQEARDRAKLAKNKVMSLCL